MQSQASRVVRLRIVSACAAALIAVMAAGFGAGQARAASPVLEFASSASLPLDFTADGGEVTAALAGFDSVVQCADSHGDGQIVGPRATLSSYVFTGCEAQGDTEDGVSCQSEGAGTGEIKTGTIEADLVFIDQAKHEVGMLLNPGGGVYMTFQCGGQSVKAVGPFVAPVGPINTETTEFTATLTRSGATQTPSEYENALGEKRQAIPMAERNGNPLATTGVDLSFAIQPIAALEIKAITAAEIENKQHEEEAAAAKKRQDEEAAAAAATKKREAEEAAAAAAVKQREAEEFQTEQVRRARQLSQGLARCRKAEAKQKRMRCEKRVKKKFAVLR